MMRHQEGSKNFLDLTLSWQEPTQVAAEICEQSFSEKGSICIIYKFHKRSKLF